LVEAVHSLWLWLYIAAFLPFLNGDESGSLTMRMQPEFWDLPQSFGMIQDKTMPWYVLCKNVN